MSSKGEQRSKSQLRSREQRQAEKQTLVLWALLANGGEGFAKELKPAVDKVERDGLLKAGLIAVEKRKRGAYWLSVTDRGWRWAEDHLSDKLPDRSYAGTFILTAWLKHLQTFMRVSNTPLADILVPRKNTVTDYGDLRERIRTAYLAVTGGMLNKRALLSDVRKHLPNVDRATLDNTLELMQRDGDVTLMQLDNRPDITPADEEAAIRIGQEARHILWISQ
jgi:hypothetical protein